MSAERIVSGLPDPQGRGEDPIFFAIALYARFLQFLFRQFEPQNYHWSESEEDTEIHITGETPVPRTVIEARPALVVQRGPAQFSNLSLNNMRDLDQRTGTATFTDLLAGTMSISCITNKSEVEAGRLAWIVQSCIRRHKVLLQKSGFHKVGDEVSMSPPSPPGQLVSPEADPTAVMVTVYSPWFLQWTERVTPLDAPALREFDVFMRVGALPAIATSTKVREAALRPVSFNGRPVVGDGIGESIPMDLPPVSTTVKVT